MFNKEIIGYSYGKNKTAELVNKAFISVDTSLSNINMFHTDRGTEFKNILIVELLETFEIKRSLSKKGCPYDNAIAEATFKIIKTEFANIIFKDFDELEYLLFDYVNWFNKFRIYSSLNYMSPVDFRLSLSE